MDEKEGGKVTLDEAIKWWLKNEREYAHRLMYGGTRGIAEVLAAYAKRERAAQHEHS